MKAHLPLVVVLASAVHLTRAQEKPSETPPAPPATTEVYDPKAVDVLRGKKGQILTVEGTIVRAGENRAKTFRYLNFTLNFRESVSLVFPVAKNAEFTMEKLNEWSGRKVRATGTLSEFGGNLQITIEKWDQLRKMEDAPAPAEPPK
jgi:hypothetical protein